MFSLVTVNSVLAMPSIEGVELSPLGWFGLVMVFCGICFGHTFVEAIATSKLVNIASSLVATLVFIRLGIVNYGLGLLLGMAMFVGAFWGGHWVLKLSDRWLKGIYLTTVIGLAIKLLLEP